MFRNLKQKLGESLSGSPARNLLLADQGKQNEGSAASQSAQIEASNSSSALASSVVCSSDEANDSGLQEPVQAQTVTKPETCRLPKDIEDGLDDCYDDIPLDVSSIDREHLLQIHSKAAEQRRKCVQLLAAFRELEREYSRSKEADETELSTLTDKVKRLELLLGKCKETIRINKEKVQHLTNDLETEEKQLQIKTKEFESLQAQHADSLTRSHLQMTEAKKMIEDLKSDRQVAVAVAKRDFREQLEARDEELTRCRELLRQTQTENDTLNLTLEQAKQSGEAEIGKLNEALMELTNENSRLNEELQRLSEQKSSSNDVLSPDTRGSSSNVLVGVDGRSVTNNSKHIVSRVCESLDRFTEALTRSDILPSTSDLQAQIDKLRADIFTDFPLDEVVTSSVIGCNQSDADVTASDADVKRELVKARERIEELETEIEQSKHGGDVITTESADQLAQATGQVAHLEGRIRELVDRENQLNAELEHMRLTDHQRTLQQNQQILTLRAEVDAMRKNEVSLRENLSQTTARCEEQLSQAKAENMEAVDQLSAMVQDNQSELLKVLTELDVARRRLDVTAGKLDERSTQLEDALQQVKLTGDSLNEMRQSNGDLVKRVGELESERGLLSERVGAYEHAAVDGVVGAEELVRQTSDLEKQLAERDGTVVKLETVVTHLEEVIKNLESREEALVTENSHLQQELDSANTDQLKAMAGLHGKVQLFQQVIEQRDKEISNLRREIASRKEAAGGSQLSGSSFGKIVAASAETDDARRLSRLQEIFRQINAAHTDEVSSLSQQLEQANDSMQLFKQHAKKQFEEQQEKVKWMIQQLKDGFDDSIRDREEVHLRKMQNFERQKNKEKNVALQELQQHLDELTANHESAIEAMKAAHCEEMESLRKAFSSQMAPGAFVTHTAALTNEPVGSLQSNSLSRKAIDSVSASCGLCHNNLSHLRGLRDLAALYHYECQHTACLRSKLNTVMEFLAYIDNLDQSADAVKECLSDDICKDDSDITSEDSRANILAAVRTFALSFQQVVSDFPLQIENLQRVEQFSLRRMQLSVLPSSDEVHDFTSAENKQLTSSYREISSLSVRDDKPRISDESGISMNVDSSEDDHRSPMHSYNYTDSVKERTDVGREQKEEISEEATVAVNVTEELITANEEHLTSSSTTDVLDGNLQEQFNILNRQFELQSAELRDTVTELSQYKEKNESQASEISTLRKDIELLQASNAEITNQVIEKSMFEKQCSLLQLELNSLKERTSQLQEETSSLQRDKDSLQECADLLQKKVQDQATELETNSRTVEMLDDKIFMLTSELDERAEQLEKKNSESDAMNKSLEPSNLQLQVGADESSRLKTQHENERKDLTNELQSVKDNISALETERDILKNQINQQSEEFESSLSESVSKYQMKCDALTEELQSSQCQLTKLADELQHSKDSLRELEAEMERSVTECADLKRQLLELKSELKTCRQESELLLQKEREMYQSVVEDKDSELMKCADQICCLREDIERLNVEISDKDRATEAELQQLTEQQASVEERTAHEQILLKEDCDLKANELNAMKQKLFENAAELEQVKEVYETKVAQLSLKIDELQDKLETDQKFWDAAVVKLTDSHTAELETKDSEIATLTRTIQSLKDKLSSQHDELSSAVSSKDETVSSAEEKHWFEVAAVTERFEKKISELEHGHHCTVEEYRQRIAEMERSDVELNTQLIAVTEKFNSVTEYTANAERLIKDYQSKANKWAAEREEIIKAAETACDKLSEKEAEISALKEQIQMLKPPVHGMPLLDVKSVEMEAAEVVNHDNYEPPVTTDLPCSSSQGLDDETCSSDISHCESDELMKLQQEGVNVVRELNQQQLENAESLKVWHEKVTEQMKLEHRAEIHDLEDEHNTKVINLIKDFYAQMATHEKELRESMNSDLESWQKKESRLLYEHNAQVAQLSDELHERDLQIKQYETDMQDAESRYKADIEQLKESIDVLRQQLAHSIPTVDDSSSQSREVAARADDSGQCQTLTAENCCLQEEVSRLSEELLLLRNSEHELRREIETLRGISHETSGHRGLSSTGQLLPEPTELEYLRNILYKYMLGTETKTLAKVICSVMRFNEEETCMVLEREESRREKSIWSSVLHGDSSPSTLFSSPTARPRLQSSSSGRARPSSTLREKSPPPVYL